jgi:hypothetical protein
VESNWVHSALRPLMGLLCQPRVIMMMEKLVECLAGETEVLGENLPNGYLFVCSLFKDISNLDYSPVESSD